MRTSPEDFAAILVRRGILTTEQLDDARGLAAKNKISLQQAIARLQYATSVEVYRALAEAHGLAFLDLTGLTVPQMALELVPETMARLYVILPLALQKGDLWLIIADPSAQEALQDLRLLLNIEIHPVLAPREQILEAIHRHYGQSETESVDSILAEFTDTAIDFTATDSARRDESSFEFELTLNDESAAPSGGSADKDIFETDFDSPPTADESGSEALTLDGSDTDLASSDFDLAASDGSVDELLCEEEAEVEAAPRRYRCGSAPLVHRQATVRHYCRMNPQRMYPLLVIISRQAIAEVVKRHVTQQTSKQFQVKLDSVVEIEPVLPGCQCYPPKEQVSITKGEAVAKFYVVPHVLGQVMLARVVVRQEGKVLAEVPLEVRVVKQGLTLLMGALSLALPFGMMVLKHYGLDFESQKAEGFGLYAQLGNWALNSLRPETVTALLLVLTTACYFWLRPRKRDVFWDVRPLSPAEAARAAATEDAQAGKETAVNPVPAKHLDHQDALFATADDLYSQQNFAAALQVYESGLVLGKAPAMIYQRAAIAAWKVGNALRALAIMQTAQSMLPPDQMKGAMWYNMGCFATRLGKLADAVRYLNRAVDAGYTNVEKFRTDPDLAPLRWRSDFRSLLGSIKHQAPTRG